MKELRTAEDFWEAAKQLGEVIAAQRAAHRQALRDARNARRRVRYRQSPPKPKATPVPVIVDDDLGWEPGCRCNVVNNPPCTWCTSGEQADDD